jgi:hypothetical protein
MEIFHLPEIFWLLHRHKPHLGLILSQKNSFFQAWQQARKIILETFFQAQLETF